MNDIVNQLREFSNCIRDDIEAKFVQDAADEIERLNESLHRAWDELSRLRGYLNAWADADDAREGHSATCFEHGTCGVEMCREENGLRLGVWR